MDSINSMKFDYVASGHYANVVHPPASQTDKDSVLELSQDMVPVYDTPLTTYIFIFLSFWIINIGLLNLLSLRLFHLIQIGFFAM